jgi:hypothetical protein
LTFHFTILRFSTLFSDFQQAEGTGKHRARKKAVQPEDNIPTDDNIRIAFFAMLTKLKISVSQQDTTRCPRRLDLDRNRLCVMSQTVLLGFNDGRV